MAKRFLRFVSIGANDITFADPLSATRTTRFTHSTTNVTGPDGIIPTHRAELISLSTVRVKIPGCNETCSSNFQPVSVRIKLSAPLANSAEAKQQVIDALENMKTALSQGLTDGFIPTLNTADLVVDHNLE